MASVLTRDREGENTQTQEKALGRQRGRLALTATSLGMPGARKLADEETDPPLEGVWPC